MCVCVRLVQEAGGCVSLVQLLSDSQALSRSGAAATISNMAASQNARSAPSTHMYSQRNL